LIFDLPGEGGRTSETRPLSPSIPGAVEPRSGAAGHPHAAPAPTKQLTQQGGDGGGGEQRRSRGIVLSGWGGGLFRFPGLCRSPAPPVFPSLYLQRDSLALELFAAGRCVTSLVPTPEDKRKSKREKGYEVKFFLKYFFFLKKKSPFRVFLDDKVKKEIKMGRNMEGYNSFASFPPHFFLLCFFFDFLIFITFFCTFKRKTYLRRSSEEPPSAFLCVCFITRFQIDLHLFEIIDDVRKRGRGERKREREKKKERGKKEKKKVN